MNLVIDCGNTRIKAAFFSGEKPVEKFSFATKEELAGFLKSTECDSVIVSSVSLPGNEVLELVKAKKKYLLTYTLPLPVEVKYKTPQTLGVDRIAAVCGASVLFPATNCLVIDAGTCITFDFIDSTKNYLGGAISPGIAMRFEAMHTFTKKLPLVTAAGAEKLIGDSTESCMRSGVTNGILAEVEGIIEKYRAIYPDLRVVLCGGDTRFFENNLKPTIFATPELVLIGLNWILVYNASL
ncbi:type III pantothenate kinase [Cytophagales bacterium WSM2-2]|nr:type III pantothenate kinase [Cytophagales bacterium WSM2-2]